MAQPVSSVVRASNATILDFLPFDDTTDFEDARRGVIGRLDPCVVRAADGRVVWDNESFGFLDGTAPDTVNPSLWRQSRLAAMDGLFEVVPGIYQVRGFDISNITFVEGDSGVIVIAARPADRTGPRRRRAGCSRSRSNRNRRSRRPAHRRLRARSGRS